MATSIAHIHPTLEEAARLSSGGSRLRDLWQRFVTIFFPLVRRGLVFAGLVVFTFSMRELDTISLFKGGNDTIVMRIFNGIHWSQDALVAAQCLWLLVATILPLTLARLLFSGRAQAPGA